MAPARASIKQSPTITAMDERRVSMTRVLRAGREDDGEFDREFWRAVGAEGIFSAAWEMVQERRAFRGDDSDEGRLQRAVVRITRRGQR